MQGGGDDSNGESVEWNSHHYQQKQQQKQQQQEQEQPQQQQQRQWKVVREEDDEWSKTAAKRRSSVWPVVATFITALAVGHIVSLRRRLLSFERLGRQEANSSKYESSNSHRGGSSSSNDGSTNYRTYWTYDGNRFYQREGFSQRDTRRKDEARSKIWREGFFSAEDLERWERLRRMQEAFLRERAKYTRSYEGWQRPHSNEQTWRNDWERWHNTGYSNGGYQTPQSAWRSSYARNYEVLGLDPSRAASYSQAEIKAAYRARAMEYHPDRNQHRKAFAEEKFRDVIAAYEALKA